MLQDHILSGPIRLGKTPRKIATKRKGAGVMIRKSKGSLGRRTERKLVRIRAAHITSRKRGGVRTSRTPQGGRELLIWPKGKGKSLSKTQETRNIPKRMLDCIEGGGRVKKICTIRNTGIITKTKDSEDNVTFSSLQKRRNWGNLRRKNKV